ncbi:MAG: DinB family protein [Flammeovirgaceae bacterium]|nr:MAG: DinB family protein [Flammeovirgaceae bacterium]
MKTDVQKIIDIVSHTYEKNAWHGPAVKEMLAKLKPEHATLRVGNSHSVEELIRHMAAWRNYVIKKLQGDEHFELSDEDNFPTQKNWNEAIRLLEESQLILIETLQQTPDDLLWQKVPGRPFKYFTMLHGIIHHDVYHIGQIMLIMKGYGLA